MFNQCSDTRNGSQSAFSIGLLIAVAAAVIAGNFILGSIGKYPFASPNSEHSPDGELVIFTGTIDQVTVIKNGGHILIDSGNTTIFIPAQVAGSTGFVKGGDFTLFGTVQTYRSEKEIMVNSAEDFRFLP